MLADGVLARMAAGLVRVQGVRAVALGGSRARGTHGPDSDVDLGLYYDRDALDLDALRVQAREWAGSEVEVAGPGRWGPWVDGGAWLSVDGTAVDWILRDVHRVREQRDRAVLGRFGFFPQPGHPLGFLDVSYAGEVATGVPLADPDGVLAELREGTSPYPRALRDALVANLWQADFLLDGAGKGASRGDVAYVALCCSTAFLVCGHAWHAVAGVWVTNEKGLVPAVEALPLDTHHFARDAATALAAIGEADEDLRATVRRARTVVAAVMGSTTGAA